MIVFSSKVLDLYRDRRQVLCNKVFTIVCSSCTINHYMALKEYTTNIVSA